MNSGVELKGNVSSCDSKTSHHAPITLCYSEMSHKILYYASGIHTMRSNSL